MKSKYPLLALAAISLIATGCQSMTPYTKTASTELVGKYPPTVKIGDVVEEAITLAKELNFPAATLIDKDKGTVAFGNWGMPMMGITAQVRIPEPGEFRASIANGSLFGVNTRKGVDEEFRSKLEQRLNEKYGAKGGVAAK